MAETAHTQRRVPAAGACAHGTQAGTGDEGVEEIRDGGLRLVGSTLPTPTLRLRPSGSDQKLQQQNNYRHAVEPECSAPSRAWPTRSYEIANSAAEANENKEGNFDIRIVDQRSPGASIFAFRSMAASRSAQIPGPRGEMDWISTEDAITVGMLAISVILVLASLSAAGATGKSFLNRGFKHSLL